MTQDELIARLMRHGRADAPVIAKKIGGPEFEIVATGVRHDGKVVVMLSAMDAD
jgi:predicted signal transduction protein with EAL and GGDEF domain